MTNKKVRVLVVFGTRPEAIKMAPIVKQLNSQNNHFETVVCVTAQHREMLNQVLDLFKIKPNYDLDLMTTNQTLDELTSKIILDVTEVLKKEDANVILVQGDTTTAFMAALAAFYLKIPIGHVEAGLRTRNKYSPFPEEMNRQLIGMLADYHFAPTQWAKENLLREGVNPNSIIVTGNTVIDAFNIMVEKQKDPIINKKWKNFFGSQFDVSFQSDLKTVLVTGHRRESFGKGFKNICSALKRLVENNSDIQIIYPVHLNPNVQKPVYSILGNVDRVHLIPPLDYEPFVYLMCNSYLILTDSGGVQEEAPTLGKPVLVMRGVTERSEGIKAGTAKLVGTDRERIVSETENLLYNSNEYKKMSKSTNPYGDGHAAEKIVKFLLSKKLN